MTLRYSLKQAGELLAVRAGLARLGTWLHREGTLVLAYHNVIPDEAPPVGDRSLHIPRAKFARQLNLLLDASLVTDLAQLRSGAPLPASVKPRVIITFDDAYVGVIENALPELRDRSLPATLFVAPHFVGGRTFWWDALSAGREPMPASIRQQALDIHHGRDWKIRAWWNTGRLVEGSLPPYCRCASLRELEAATRQPGITVGAHSWSHPNLTKLDQDDLESELQRPLDWIGEHFDDPQPWLAYPYGLYDRRVEELAAKVGYVGGFHIAGGWVSQSRSTFTLPRLHIASGVSDAGFLLRVAGIVKH